MRPPGLGPAWVAALDALLPWLWGAMSVGAAGFVGASVLRLRWERRRWSWGRVDGEPVLLSEDRGPAVVGLLSPAVVLPGWIAELEEDVRRAVLLHEREHVRAGDHRVFAAGVAAALLAPWNPFLWWQLRRLRLALECDCDARVLSRGVPRAAYGRSLVRVGARLSRAPWGSAAFAEPRSFLQRRVEIMTERGSRLRGPRTAAATAAAGALLLLACETSPPAGTEPGATLGEAQAVRAGAEAGGPPEAIPYDTPPRLANASEVVQALKDRYPAELEEAGVGGTVALWMYVEENGRVTNTTVKETSGHAELDAAAREVAATMSFSPALRDEEPTDVWVSQQIVFEPPQAGAGPLAHILERPPEERPLIAVDGEVRAASASELADLEPDDIARIEILKGEAALSRYGDRGRNGAILITTKRAAGEG